MRKHFTFESLPIKWLLLCMLIGVTLSRGWSIPSNLYKVVNERLEKFEPEPENFIVKTVDHNGQKAYQLKFTLPELTMLVSKSRDNKIPHKLENGDGAIFVGPDFEYMLGAGKTDDLEMPENADFLTAYDHLKNNDPDFEFIGELNMQPYEMEAWPTKMLMRAVDNHQEVLKYLKKYYWGNSTKFLGEKEIRLKGNTEQGTLDLEKMFVDSISITVERLVDRNLSKIIIPQRNAIYENRFCLFKNSICHTENWEVKYESKKVVNDKMKNIRLPEFNELFGEFFNQKVAPILSLKNVYIVLKREVLGENLRKNLILKILNHALLDIDPDQYNGFDMGVYNSIFNNNLSVGVYLKEYFNNKLNKVFKGVLINNIKDFTPKSEQQKTLPDYAAEITDKIKSEFRSAIEEMNTNTLKKSYSVEFTPDQLESMVEELEKKTDIFDYLSGMFSSLVSRHIEFFFKCYAEVTLKHTLLGDIIMQQLPGYFENKDMNHLEFFFDRFVMLAKLTGVAELLDQSPNSPVIFQK